MENISFWEFIILTVVFVLQIVALYYVGKQISKLKRFIPERNKIKIKQYTLLASELNHDSIPQVVQEIEKHEEFALSQTDVQTVQVSLLHLEKGEDYSEDYTEVVQDINTYLLRNYSSIADFNIINGLINRKLEHLQEKAQSLVYAPLYLGLFGTMVGVVFGLSNINTNQAADEIMEVFVPSVAFAMSVSAFGLAFTTIMSYIFLRKATHTQDENKNAINTLLQIELLPVVNQGMTDTFLQLQRSLLQFNKDFEKNTKKFFEASEKSVLSFQKNAENIAKLIDRNYIAIEKQSELIKAINNANIQDITQNNLNIMAKLTVALEKFDRFAAYIDNLNDTLRKTARIVDLLDETLIQTKKLTELSEKLDDRLELSQKILEFIDKQFNQFNKMADNQKIAIEQSRQSFTKVLEDIQSLYQDSLNQSKQKLIENFNQFSRIIPEFQENVETSFNHLSEYIKERLTDIQQQEKEMMNVLQKEGTHLQSLRYLEPITDTQIVLAKQLSVEKEMLEQLKILLLWSVALQSEKSIFSKKKIREINQFYSDLYEKQKENLERKLKELPAINVDVSKNKSASDSQKGTNTSPAIQMYISPSAIDAQNACIKNEYKTALNPETCFIITVNSDSLDEGSINIPMHNAGAILAHQDKILHGFIAEKHNYVANALCTIKSTEPGKVKKQNNKWYIEEPIQIYFEKV